MTLKILITGSDGLLGKLLLKKLKARYDVIGTSKIKQNKFQIKCNITKKEDIFRVVKKVKPDIIIHLAGITGNVECEENPHKTLETNVMGTYYILDAIKDKKIRLIFSSSREVYGNSKYKVNENFPLQPININGISKMISENLILDFHLTHKVPFNILRFTNFYGENNEKRGISKMIKDSLDSKKITIFGGKQSIDLIHYDDAAESIIKTIEYKKSGIFNIGNGESITLLSLLKILENISKIKINFFTEKSRKFEVKEFHIDISKAKEKLDFEPKISPKIGIRKMIKKWKKN